MVSSPSKKKHPPQKTSAKKLAEKKPRVRNPEKTRAKLLQATIDLLAEKGPDALSLKEAARLANVSRGVAYQHFEDRDHLLREAKAWIADRLLEAAENIQPALSAKDMNRVLEERVRESTRLVLNNREAARLWISDALAGRELDTNHPIYKIVVSGIEQLKQSGIARADADTEMLTYIMLGSTAVAIMLSYLPNAGDTEALAERYTREWTRFIREGMYDKPAAKSSKPAKAKAAPAKRTAKAKSNARSKS